MTENDLMNKGFIPDGKGGWAKKNKDGSLTKVTLQIEEKTIPDVTELQIHDQFIDWLRTKDIHTYIHSRTDRRPTITEGWPDFTILHEGHALCLEIKSPTGRISTSQERCFRLLRDSGTPAFVVYSLAEAIEFTNAFLKKNERP